MEVDVYDEEEYGLAWCKGVCMFEGYLMCVCFF